MSRASLPPPLLLPSNAPPKSDAADPGPRLDFLALAAALDDAPLLYPPPAAPGLMGKVEDKTASDLRQAWAAVRRRGTVGAYVSLSEKVGLPLALLQGRRSRVPHVLIAHNLTSERKRRLQARTGWLHRFSRVVVLCREQERYLRNEAGLPPERVRFVYDKVDHRFWLPSPPNPLPHAVGEGEQHHQTTKVPSSPHSPPPPQRGGGGWGERATHILSVGRERRDYTTLVAAARLLPERKFVVVVSSPWSRQAGSGGEGQIPDNVCFRRGLPWDELRALYAGAAAVVVPLEAGTLYAAGVNGVLEAMAMGRPLVVTGTPGIADYIDDGVNARVVPPADPAALADALRALLADINGSARLGANARAVVENGRNLDAYVAALMGIVREAMAEGAAR
jgi:glycosyltransferase involved in cell wall biosynthesis